MRRRDKQPVLPAVLPPDRIIRPYEDDSTGYGYLVQFIWDGRSVDDFLIDQGDTRDRVVGAGLREGYDVRVVPGWPGPEVRCYLEWTDLLHQAGPSEWSAPDPALLSRLRQAPGDR